MTAKNGVYKSEFWSNVSFKVIVNKNNYVHIYILFDSKEIYF